MINTRKAQVLCFSKNNRVVKDEVPAVHCNGMQVRRVHGLKYSGNTFDRSLSWRRHIDRVVQLAWKGLSAVKLVASWDIQQWMLVRLMQALVLRLWSRANDLIQSPNWQIGQNSKCSYAGCPVTMRYLLGRPGMGIRHKAGQVEAYFTVVTSTTHPLHK